MFLRSWEMIIPQDLDITSQKLLKILAVKSYAETFPDGNSDFTSYITSAKNAGADVFFAPTSTEAAALIIEQAAAQGLDLPLLAGDTWDSNVILKAAEGQGCTGICNNLLSGGR